MNWSLALAIGRATAERKRRALLTLAIVVNLVALGWFKYAGFLVENLGWMATQLGLPAPPVPSTHLPIGISFVTFEAISYLIDVYRGTIVAQRNPIHVGFFMSFFPHLIAGPVLRFSNVAGPLHGSDSHADGLRVGHPHLHHRPGEEGADREHGRAWPTRCSGSPASALSDGAAWLGVVAYAFQIYFDFSGYSDMAIGLGSHVRLRAAAELRPPLRLDVSIQEFWRRWHITLSSWFRDYLYIPLGGNRTAPFRQLRQPVHGLPALRALARRELDLRRAGAPSTDSSW